MDMRLAPLDTTKMEVYKELWKDCDNPISFGATVVYVSSAHPLFTRKLLHRVQKQCSKGPPITKVLSSIS